MTARLSFRDWPSGATRTLAVLSVTMIIAWGTLFYGITLIGPRIMAETGWSKSLIFGAFSLAMLTSGLIAPRIGGLIDRSGGRHVMAIGSVVGGVGYALLAYAANPVMLYFAYAIIGLGMAGSLYDPAFASLARIAGPKARTAITLLTLGGGLASTVFWPLGLWLLSFMDWRGLCLVYAALNGIVCAALHLGGISGEKRPPHRQARRRRRPSGMAPPIRPCAARSSRCWPLSSWRMGWSAMACRSTSPPCLQRWGSARRRPSASAR